MYSAHSLQTVHGPIIDETSNMPYHTVISTALDNYGINATSYDNYHLALKSTSLIAEVSSPTFILYGPYQVKNMKELLEFNQRISTPCFSSAMADSQGNIAIRLSGQVPVRANGDGTTPVPGWTGEYDWVGYIPQHGTHFWFLTGKWSYY